MKIKAKLGTALACAALLGSTALAQGAAPSPEDQAKQAVELRQSVFKLLGYNMAPLGGMLRGNAPFDAAVVKTNANYIANLAPMISPLFVKDTHEFKLETEALDNIWTNKADFDTKATALVDAAKKVAEASDEAGLKAAVGAMGRTCGSCHDDFRVKKN